MFPRIPILLFLLALARPVGAELELAGVFYMKDDGRFSLADSESGRKSGWLRLGQSFAGYALESYDPEERVLLVRSAEETLKLALRSPGIPVAPPPPEESDEPTQIVGIGASLAMGDDGAQILKVLPDYPAAKAQLKEGQIILRVDGIPLEGKTLRASADLIRGKANTSVRLEVYDPDEDNVRQVFITREPLPMAEHIKTGE